MNMLIYVTYMGEVVSHCSLIENLFSTLHYVNTWGPGGPIRYELKK